MTDDLNFNRIEDETCYFCKASPFVDCAVDCPVNFAQFGQTIPDSLRGVITMELLKQAEWIYEKKQAEWMDKMLIERVENVMKDWPMFISFIEVLRRLSYFRTVDDLIDYLKYPSHREKVFLAWTECGSPITEGTKNWEMFVTAIKNLTSIAEFYKTDKEFMKEVLTTLNKIFEKKYEIIPKKSEIDFNLRNKLSFIGL